MDPVDTIIIFLGVQTIMAAAILALLTVIKGQLANLLANSINAADAAAIQASAQELSDTLTAAGSPPAP